MDITRSLSPLILIITFLLLSSLSVLGFSIRLPILSLSSRIGSTKDLDCYAPKGNFDDSDHDAVHRRNSRRQLNQQNHERTVVIAYHKPANTITSHGDANAIASTKKGPRQTVYDDILTMQGWRSESTKSKNENVATDNISFEKVTGIRSRLHAIGRLDCDTTGLLLLTNNGGLVHHVTNPTAKTVLSSTTEDCKSGSNKITKTYEAVIMGYHENNCAAFERMRTEGVDIGAKYGGQTQPVEDLQVLDHPTSKSTLVSLTISEGRNRQVRRMFHSIGSGVMKLRRVKIGSLLTLEGLEEAGQWRIMPDAEVEATLGWAVRDLVGKKEIYKGGEVGEGTKRSRSSRRTRGRQGENGRSGRQSLTKHPKSSGRRRS